MNAAKRAQGLLGEAFVADPLMVHAFGPDGGGPRRLTRLFGPVIEACCRHGGVLVETSAAAAWLPGTLVPLSWGARFQAGFGRLPLALSPAALLRLQRHESACETAIRARFARRRFGYLWLFGVAPASRGQGAGRSLMDAVLARMAGEFDLCVLKTENPDTAGFYRAMGFAPQDRFEVPASQLDVQVFARSVLI